MPATTKVVQELKDTQIGGESVWRILESAGYLMAYDDPVGVAREIKAFCV